MLSERDSATWGPTLPVSPSVVFIPETMMKREYPSLDFPQFLIRAWSAGISFPTASCDMALSFTAGSSEYTMFGRRFCVIEFFGLGDDRVSGAAPLLIIVESSSIGFDVPLEDLLYTQGDCVGRGERVGARHLPVAENERLVDAEDLCMVEGLH